MSNTIEEKQYLIELSDNEYKVITEKELIDIEKSAIEFDGFTGIRVVGNISELNKLKQENTELKERVKELEKSLSDITMKYKFNQTKTQAKNNHLDDILIKAEQLLTNK